MARGGAAPPDAPSRSWSREALGERGIRLDGKTVRRFALHVGGEARAQRAVRTKAAELGLVFTKELEGKRIVILTDGGRIRLREGGCRGHKGKSGRRRFLTPWRESKLIVVYVIDEKGRRDLTVPVSYDGTLEDTTAVETNIHFPHTVVRSIRLPCRRPEPWSSWAAQARSSRSAGDTSRRLHSGFRGSSLRGGMSVCRIDHSR